MKVFITGATGFIGTHLIKRLAQTDYQMRCLVRTPSKASQLKASGAEVTIGDVTDKNCVREGMHGCGMVIHLAGLYSFWEPNKKIFSDINVTGTRNVMEAALQEGVSKIVHVSTVGIYGKPADCPFTEDSAVGPVRFCTYFQTKYEGDLIAWELYEKKGLPLVAVYPASVLGPGDPKPTGHAIDDLIHGRIPARILENSVMTYVYVGDVAEAIVRALEKENNIGERYLVGKEQLSLGQFSQMVCTLAGVPLPKGATPDALVLPMAALLTWVADLTKKPPVMELEGMRVMKEGFRCDGSKAERELGITYTPIRTALEEAVVSYQN